MIYGVRKMRVALLSNITVDLLASMVQKTNDVYLSAGFDTWQQEMIMPASGLYEYKPEAIVVLLHANAYADVWDDKRNGEQIIDEWCEAVQTACSNIPGIPIFISSIDVSNVKVRYGAEKRLDQYFENYMNEKIGNLHASGCNIYVLPVKDIISDLGRNNFYTAKMWYIGSMPYSMKGLSALNDLITRYIGAIKGMNKKCLAIDLDNTLWGGVIGEDGINGIVLDNNREGARYKDAQRILKKMKSQGVMLAILSKNNVEDVEPVFSHPDMVLQHEDFVAEAINWEPKSMNIRKLAIELNIGLESFVFLDDNPAEREQMKAECPEVAVVEFPKDTSFLPDTIVKVYDEYFLSLEVTSEDAKKTVMYRAEARRNAEMFAATSAEDFLKKLEMKMDIHLMRPEEEKRVTQLTNKTNQFNVTTKRYSEEEIHKLTESGDVITVHMADRYGDQGLVAVLILKYEGDVAEIDTFLMSCRVMGRKAEDEIMARIRGYLETKGVRMVKASYIKTPKNRPVLELFDKFGFARTSGEIRENGDMKNYIASIDVLPISTGIFKNVVEEWS